MARLEPTIVVALRCHISKAAKWQSGKTGGSLGGDCVHPVKSDRDHGSDIQDVSGSGNFPAASTVSHPLGSGIILSLPLRAIQRMTPLASQAHH